MHQGNNSKDRLSMYAAMSINDLFRCTGSTESGLTHEKVSANRQAYGSNAAVTTHNDSVLYRLRKSFVNPFSIVLLILAAISFLTDILLPDNLKPGFTSVIIIISMLLVSGFVRFVQEMRTKAVSDRLIKLINTTISVKRDGKWEKLSSEDLVAGDFVRLRAGDRVPADMRIISSSECFVSQSAITGESSIIEKHSAPVSERPSDINEYTNIIFTGSTVAGGKCEAIVIAVGEDTVYGKTAATSRNERHGFDRGANSIAWVLIKFMVTLVPIVFIACGLTQGNWLSAFIFALSVAVGLTPELLPMVINACLAKGSCNMGAKDTIVKNINAMQGFGSIDVLCTDKTGTLTNDSLVLEYYMDVFGNESGEVLDLAYLGSYYHTGIENPLDKALRQAESMPGREKHFADLVRSHEKKDELPFDYSRKASSVLVKSGDSNTIIMKGDLFSVLSHCSYALAGGELAEAGENAEDSVRFVVDEMLEDGMKVLAIATKETDSDTLSEKDEYNMVLRGYIAFFDAPKKSAASALRRLETLNVKGKILTGDSREVTASVCARLGMDTGSILTGDQLARLTDDDIQFAVEDTDIFAELTPSQKKTIIEILKSNGHSVGFLGDGMNDLPAMMEADVGISVDTAVEAIKEAADVILLKKDLNVLEDGILEGRRAFVNMSKYIRITASSNFGNILSIVIASILLPFFPMTSVQLLLLNLLYDILCLILPWDNVDMEFCRNPLEWSGRTLSRFMLSFGPVSSVFDILTFSFLFFVLCPHICGGSFAELGLISQMRFISVFQTGWFIESMWTQILILHLLRTDKLPFVQSRASNPVLLVTVLGILLFTILSFTSAGSLIGMTPLPPMYFVFLFVVVAMYLLMITFVKKIYVRKFGKLI